MVAYRGNSWLGFVVSSRFTLWPIFGKKANKGRSRVAKISQELFCEVIIVAQIPRVANISENLRKSLHRLS